MAQTVQKVFFSFFPVFLLSSVFFLFSFIPSVFFYFYSVFSSFFCFFLLFSLVLLFFFYAVFFLFCFLFFSDISVFLFLDLFYSFSFYFIVFSFSFSSFSLFLFSSFFTLFFFLLFPLFLYDPVGSRWQVRHVARNFLVICLLGHLSLGEIWGWVKKIWSKSAKYAWKGGGAETAPPPRLSLSLQTPASDSVNPSPPWALFPFDPRTIAGVFNVK